MDSVLLAMPPPYFPTTSLAVMLLMAAVAAIPPIVVYCYRHRGNYTRWQKWLAALIGLAWALLTIPELVRLSEFKDAIPCWLQYGGFVFTVSAICTAALTFASRGKRPTMRPPFDIAEYQASGRCPWTFFAFPRELAQADSMPDDPEVRELFEIVQEHGIPTALWSDPRTPETVYFACPHESRDDLDVLMKRLEQEGRFPKAFLAEGCDHLYSIVARNREPDVAPPRWPDRFWLAFLAVAGGATTAYLATSLFDASVLLSGVLCVGLIAIGRREGYLIGLYNSLAYSVLAYANGLFGEVFLNLLFFVPTGVLGYVMWSRHTRPDKTVEMRELGWRQRLVVAILCVFCTIGLGALLRFNPGQNTPFIDASTNVLSIVATFLMMWRYKEQWMLYILLNIITIGMWYLRFRAGGAAGDLMILMWSIFLLNAMFGYWRWTAGAKRNEVALCDVG